MNLTKLLKEDQTVKEIFSKIKKPTILFSKEILVPPTSSNYATNIGIAFDYLVRFYVEFINKGKTYSREKWVAEKAAEFLGNNKADTAVSTARKEYARFLDSGRLSENLIISVLGLAPLDIYARSGQFFEESLYNIDSKCVDEIKNLYDILDDKMWKCSKAAILNPLLSNWGIAPNVTGADADIILDDILIDIKTSKTEGISKQDFNQIIAYYILAELLIDNKDFAYNHLVCQQNVRLKKVGIYKARYGELLTYDIGDILTEKDVFDIKSVFTK